MQKNTAGFPDDGDSSLQSQELNGS
uniref:Uncharacterized protein n=1 Tax=Arundo donax TaxID=35708 RepID=A0A0A9FL29_ARUDO